MFTNPSFGKGFIINPSVPLVGNGVDDGAELSGVVGGGVGVGGGGGLDDFPGGALVWGPGQGRVN